MNKKGSAEKSGYFIIFIVLFGISFLYAFSLLYVDKADFNTENIEDSIIATRVLNCFSDDNFLLDKENKMNIVDLKDCFGNDKYRLEIKLDEEEPKKNTPTELRSPRKIKRYVKLKNGEEGILEIKYKKKKNEAWIS